MRLRRVVLTRPWQPFASLPPEMMAEFEAVTDSAIRSEFHRKYAFNPLTGCVDDASIDRYDNYSQLFGKVAHRVIYETCVAPIPPKFIVHHECRRMRCIRPKHLRAMTQQAHQALHGAERRARNRA